MGGLLSSPPPAPDVVLCPALFDRLRLKSNQTVSGYQVQFGNDPTDPSSRSSLFHALFPSSALPSASARVRMRPKGAKTGAPEELMSLEFDLETIGENLGGDARIRVEHPRSANTYAELMLGTDGNVGLNGAAQLLRGRNFSAGYFANLPLTTSALESSTVASLGLRFDHENGSLGVAARPDGSVKQAWCVARRGAFAVGGEYTPPRFAGDYPFSSSVSFQSSMDESEALSSNKRTLVPGFNVTAEIARGRTIVLSSLAQFSVLRSTWNPFEKNSVIGISNPIDLGFQMSVPLPEEGATPQKAPRAPANLALVGAWQLNRAWKLKAKLDSTCAQVTVAFKHAWGAPALKVALFCQADYKDPLNFSKTGFQVEFENWGTPVFARANKTERFEDSTRVDFATWDESRETKSERFYLNPPPKDETTDRLVVPREPVLATNKETKDDYTRWS